MLSYILRKTVEKGEFLSYLSIFFIELLTFSLFFCIIYTMIKIPFNKKTGVWLVRIILTLLCILMIGWIFSNSLKAAPESSQQSSQVTENVKDVIETINPDVTFGGATEEEDFNILHGIVRNMGHFCEFALLCALLTWCVLSYTTKKPFMLIPVPLAIGVAFLDEYVQTFSDGRAQEMKDVLIDSCGAASGFVFAVVAVCLGVLIFRVWQRKKLSSVGGRVESSAPVSLEAAATDAQKQNENSEQEGEENVRV